MKDYRQLCIDIFGTDNEQVLREIARNAAMHDLYGVSKRSAHKKAGRKPAVSYECMCQIVELQEKGNSIKRIAEYLKLSRQTIYKYLEPQKRWNRIDTITMRIYFMNFDKVCTIIDVDFQNQEVYTVNFTKEWICRAFGTLEEPSWEDFMNFLEQRCFSRSRDGGNQLIKSLGLDHYDPLQILEKTQGRVDGDYKWLQFEYKGMVKDERR